MNNFDKILTIQKTMEALIKVLPEGDALDGILEILDGELGKEVDTALSNGVTPEELVLMSIQNL